MITLTVLAALANTNAKFWKYSIVINKTFTTRNLPWFKCEIPPQDRGFGHLVSGGGACFERLWNLLEVGLCSRATRGWALLLILYPGFARAPCFPTAYRMSPHPFSTRMHSIPKP